MFYGPSIIFIELLLNSAGSGGTRIRIPQHRQYDPFRKIIKLG